MVANTYDLKAMRIEYIELAAKSLRKSSPMYKEDYEAICRAANIFTRKQLIESLNRQKAIWATNRAEIARHCQF